LGLVGQTAATAVRGVATITAADRHAWTGSIRRTGMTQRMSIGAVVPAGFQVLSEVERYLHSNVDPTILELVKLRASMRNGCAFCVDMHSRDAQRAGEDTRRLFAVAAWRDAPFFDEKERAALALTDAVTRLGDDGVPDDVWAEAAKYFSEEEVANLLIAIGMINLWNRISISTRTPPRPA
jgi:AhpD family alkylhydroperoxidase